MQFILNEINRMKDYFYLGLVFSVSNRIAKNKRNIPNSLKFYRQTINFIAQLKDGFLSRHIYVTLDI